MGTCVEKLPHDCGSSDGLQVFLQEDGSVNGWCFVCSTGVDDPYGDKPIPQFKVKTNEEREAEIKSVLTYPTLAIPSRKLSEETVKYFGVKVGVSQSDGVTPDSVFFPYGKDGTLTSWFFRSLCDKKKQFSIGSSKGCDLFGWGRAAKSGQRTLYITEGEFDAMALYQILKDANRGTAYADLPHAVVSVLHGAGSAVKEIGRMSQQIEKLFDQVVLVFDMDEAGQKAAEDVCRIHPNYKVAHLPCKDANECLMVGASKACKNAVVFKSAKPKNSRIVIANTLHEMSRVQAEMGLSTPFHKLTELTRGIRRGETWYWGAGVKMGKSELVNTVGAHMIKEHKCPVFFAKPEEALNKSYKMLAGKMVGKIFHDPNVQFDYEAYDRAGEMIGELALFTDVYQFLDWDTLKGDIKYAVVERGIQDVIIDPITCFTNSMNAAAANEFLTHMAAEVSSMAKDLDFTAHLFCHLKAPEAGPPHERGGKVLSTQFAGSRAMMRSCNYMVGIEGNKDPDLDKEERNMRYVKLLEDREFGASGVVPLYWDDKTSLFNEVYE